MNHNITLPTSWQQLTDDQIKLVFELLAMDLSSSEIKTLLLLHWGKIKIIGQTNKEGDFWCKINKKLAILKTKQVVAAIQPLGWLDSIPTSPVRLSRIKKNKALPADFNGVPFEKYLYLDNLFQGYLQTQREELLQQCVQILYDNEKIKPKKAHSIMAFYWLAALKHLFSIRFPHFYQPIETIQADDMLESKSLYQQLTEAVNAQIRALTGGDITKEEKVLSMDTHRALTELDCKAAEVESMNKTKQSML